jgi:archaellum biogenesis protein FlaJ (TadC family)
MDDFGYEPVREHRIKMITSVVLACIAVATIIATLAISLLWGGKIEMDPVYWFEGIILLIAVIGAWIHKVEMRIAEEGVRHE